MVFGTAKGVLFIEVSSFQGVLIRGVPLYIHVYSLLMRANKLETVLSRDRLAACLAPPDMVFHAELLLRGGGGTFAPLKKVVRITCLSPRIGSVAITRRV